MLFTIYFVLLILCFLTKSDLAKAPFMLCGAVMSWIGLWPFGLLALIVLFVTRKRKEINNMMCEMCENCKKCNDCKMSEAFLEVKDIIRINECADYEPNEESKKVIDIFGYKAQKEMKKHGRY